MKGFKKWAYVVFMGSLTCSAMSACYWQGKKYLISSSRWQSIKKELNQQHPQELASLIQGELYPFKYVQVEGTLSEQYERVQRRKQSRLGYLVLRALSYRDPEGKHQQIAALEGWCEQQFQYTPKKAINKAQIFKGILREKPKKDFIHNNFKKQELQRHHMNTYINLDQILPKLSINPSNANQKYYFQILRPLHETDYESFPYQYSIDNFQLPYLTPDKHLSYATFWGCCSILGISTIIRVLKFK